MPTIPHRISSVAAVLLLTVGLALAPIGQRVAASAATVSSAHPYSDPVWFPLHAKVYLDCVRSNPGCTVSHDGWTMDFVQETVPANGPTGDLGVYAMGAGRLHVGDASGASCREGSVSNFGTWVWIDHGGGVVSRYGHLRTGSLLPDGTYVAAGQRIASMGTTGKGSNCTVPYVNFQIRHGGLGGPRIQIKSLKVCSGRTVTVWPTALDATAHWRPLHPVFPKPSHTVRYAVWNDVPKRSVDFPATDGSCIPTAVPNSPQRPTGVSLTRAGSGRLTVHWRAASLPAPTSVQVRLSEFHPSTHTWDYTQHEDVAAVAPTTDSYRFTGLHDGHTYRATVSFHNAAGWSRPSVWVSRTAAAPPSTPRLRGLYVSGSKAATVHFKWNRSTAHGAPVSAYQVQVRRVLRTHHGKWLSSRTTSTYRTWSGLRRHATYQVRVRALSSLGNSAFLGRTVRT